MSHPPPTVARPQIHALLFRIAFPQKVYTHCTTRCIDDADNVHELVLIRCTIPYRQVSNMNIQDQAIYLLKEKAIQPRTSRQHHDVHTGRFLKTSEQLDTQAKSEQASHERVWQWVIDESQRTLHQTGKAIRRGTETIVDEVIKDFVGLGKASDASVNKDKDTATQETTANVAGGVVCDVNALTYMPGWSEDVSLPNGTVVNIRPLLSEDKERLKEGFEQLSSASRYQRFMTSMNALPDNYLSYLTDIDYIHHFAVGAAIDDPARFDIKGIGIARFIALPDTDREAELAITVLDEAQGQGLGYILMDVLLRAASERGYKALRAEVLPTNDGMQKLAQHYGGERVSLSDGLASWRVPVPKSYASNEP